MWSSWAQWSSCSKTCGTGVQKRKRTVSTKAKYGGKKCDGSNKATRSCHNKRRCPGTINHFSQYYVKKNFIFFCSEINLNICFHFSSKCIVSGQVGVDGPSVPQNVELAAK